MLSIRNLILSLAVVVPSAALCRSGVYFQPPSQRDTLMMQLTQPAPATDTLKQEITVIEIPDTEPHNDSIPALQLIKERWTLKDCINRALSKNITVLREELSLHDAVIHLSNAKLNYIPRVGITATSESSFGKVITVPDTDTKVIEELEVSANVVTDIFAGFRKYHLLQRSKLEARNVTYHIEQIRNALMLEVTYAYLNVLLAEERVDVIEDQISTLEEQRVRTSLMVDEGKRDIGDLLQLEAQISDARHQSLLTYNQRLISYFTLCQLLEIEDYLDFHIIAPQSIEVQLDMSHSSTSEIFSAAQALPQIKSANLNIEIADRNVRMARAELYPTLSLSTGYRSEFDSPLNIPRRAFSQQIKDNANAYLLFTLNIPIFNSLSARNKVESNRISKVRAEYDLSLARKEMNREIQEAFIDAHGSLEQYISAVQNVTNSDNSLHDIEVRYARGRATAADYAIAVYNCVNSRNQLALAKYQYIYKNKVLDFYRGIPIEL